MPLDTKPAVQAMRPAAVAAKLAVSLPTLWRYAREVPGFPQPRALSERCTIFLQDEVDAFIASRPTPRR